MHLLPARDECLEAFQWLAQEVQQAKGEAVVMHVEQFDGLSDAELIERFRQARAQDYAELEAQTQELEQRLRARLNPRERLRLQEALVKIQRQGGFL
jgi:cell division septum initiation protein DivIVA